MPVDTPETRGPTELAPRDASASRGPMALVSSRTDMTALGKKGATPRPEVTAAAKKGATPRPVQVGAQEPQERGSFPLGEVIGGRYKLVAFVGAGGQGEVWRAEDVEIAGHVVALKVLFDRAEGQIDKDFQLRELRMLASVSHPSVVQFKDYGWVGGRLWFVMPWYEGRDLERAIPLTRAEARRIFEQVAAGLAAVHAKGLRHQDIKPANIFLAKIDGLEDTLPILLDFGVAATADEVLVAGSPAYFAPEIAASWPTASPVVGPPADVFALALSLRVALDPEGVPEVGAFDRASLERRAREPIPPPRGPGLGYLAPHFARWLAIDPAERPTAAELVRELAVLTEPEERRRRRREALRRAWPWVGAGVVAASLGGFWAWNEVVAARKRQADLETERLEAEANARREAERAELLGGQLSEALARVDAASRRTSDALSRLDEAQAAIASAQGNLAELRQARDRLREALEAAHAEAEAHEAALSDAQRVIARLGEELAASRRRNEEQRNQLEALAAERDQLHTSLAGLRTEHEQARAELERVRTELERVRTELERVRTELDRIRSERDGLRATVEEMRRSVAQTEARADEAERPRAPRTAETAPSETPRALEPAPVLAVPTAQALGMAVVHVRPPDDETAGGPE